MATKYGFLRETQEQAQGTDEETGVSRTGLEVYLKAIFPEVNDWVHDKSVPNLIDLAGNRTTIRPDYRSETLKLIVEFDGLPHYTNPENILDDYRKSQIYENAGYKVVRIPYFIQLSNDVVKQMFGVEVSEPLFDASVPSIGVKGRNTPAYLCLPGIRRMAKEFAKYPEQYKVNIDHLRKSDPDNFTEHRFLSELVENNAMPNPKR